MQNCHILDIKESIYSHTYIQLRLVLPGRGKDGSSSNSTNDSLGEIKALLNEKFDEFSNKLVSMRRNLTPRPGRYTSRWNR